MDILIAVLGTLVVIVILAFALRRPLADYFSVLAQRTADEVLRAQEEKSRELWREERERTHEAMEAKLKLGAKDLESKKDVITELVKAMETKLEESNKHMLNSNTIHQESQKLIESLRTETGNLKKILSNNQMRGTFGQEVAEDLLRVAGFVNGENYVTQTKQDTKSSIPDITVFLPNKTKIHIDVKFPFQALQRYQETEDPSQREEHLKAFKNDIKARIKEVTTRDYINPEENTVDFVVMFVPNEMIFSFIYEKMGDVWREAMKKKVVMCGPFGFTALLRMVRQSYDNFKYQKNLHQIIAHIKTFENEYKKFSEGLDLLGSRLESTAKQFQQVSVTRDKKLSSAIEKIKSEELSLEEGKADLPEED